MPNWYFLWVFLHANELLPSTPFSKKGRSIYSLRLRYSDINRQNNIRKMFYRFREKLSLEWLCQTQLQKKAFIFDRMHKVDHLFSNKTIKGIIKWHGHYLMALSLAWISLKKSLHSCKQNLYEHAFRFSCLMSLHYRNKWSNSTH